VVVQFDAKGTWRNEETGFLQHGEALFLLNSRLNPRNLRRFLSMEKGPGPDVKMCHRPTLSTVKVKNKYKLQLI